MSDYNFTRPDKDTIVIWNDRGERSHYSVSILRSMVTSTGLPEATREMAREALQHYGLLQETQEEEILSSDTIVTIDGVKVYQDLLTRVFFFISRGARLFGSLSDIERKIKGSGR